MTYLIISFDGDYAVEKQPLWSREYDLKERAIKFARLQHNSLIHQYENLYTIVVEKDNDEIVEWIKHRGVEIVDSEKATNLADKLYSVKEA